LLKGLIFGSTAWAMTPAHTRKGGKLYRYYVSTDVLKRDAEACTVRRIPAAEIERAVVEQLRGLLRAPEIIERTWRAAKSIGDPSKVDVTTSNCLFDHLARAALNLEGRRVR
jgi:hypothetical protein